MLLRACGLAACPTGGRVSAGVQLVAARRLGLARIARDRQRGKRARLVAALRDAPA